MPYSSYDEILAMSGMTTDEVSSANVATIMTIVDRIVDYETESAMGSDQKKDAANNLACSYVMANTGGALSEAALSELEGAIKIDNRTASTLKSGLSKMFFDRYQMLVSLGIKTSLVKRVP